MIHNSVRTLLSGLIDYAGLFPPAGLDMKTAVQNYLNYRKGEFGWVLGRFVAPVSSLEEVRAAAAGQPVGITALIVGDADAEIQAAKSAGVESIEMKAGTPAQIRAAAERLPEGLTCYMEIPLAQDPRKSVEAMAEAGVRAKARTGGLTVDAFPGSRDLARFLQACVDANVEFKVTAGLHHPVRSLQALSDEPDSQSVEMHGFLNVFLAAAFVRAGMESVQVVRMLEDQRPESFRFEEGGASWRDEYLDAGQLADTRKNVAIAFGSCSFDGPIAELKSLGIL